MVGLEESRRYIRDQPSLPVIDYLHSRPCFIHLSLLLQVVALPAYKKKHIIGILSLYCDMIKRFQGSFVFSTQFLYYLHGNANMVMQVCCILNSKKTLNNFVVLAKGYNSGSIDEPYT